MNLKVKLKSRNSLAKYRNPHLQNCEARRHGRANPVAAAHKHLVCQTGLLRQDGGYGMAQQECARHGLFQKLVLHRMCLCRTAQDRAVLLSENLRTN